MCPKSSDNQKELLRRWQTARAFLPDLLSAIDFHGTDAAAPILEAFRYLTEIDWKGRKGIEDAPLWVLNKGWRRLAAGNNGKPDRKAFSLGVLEALQDGLKRRDVYVYPSQRWAGPRAKLLLSGKACETASRVSCARWSSRTPRRSTCTSSAYGWMRPTGARRITCPATPT